MTNEELAAVVRISEQQIKDGKTVPWEDVKRELAERLK